MLRTFIDESSDGKMFVVAGYAALCSSWEPITAEWSLVLKHQPRLDYYRTHDLLSSKWRDQNGWTEHQADTKRRHLADVIERRKVDLLFAIYATVMEDEFRAAVKLFRLKKALQQPYQFCFFAVVAEALKKLIEDDIVGDQVKMDFVLDNNGNVTRQSERIVEGIRPILANKQMAALLGDAIPQDDRHVAAIQMADMLAARVRRYMAQGGKESREELRKVQPEPEAKKVIGIQLTKDTLEKFLRDEIFTPNSLS